MCDGKTSVNVSCHLRTGRVNSGGTIFKLRDSNQVT